MVVVVLLALVWAAVLVPPAVVARRQRQEAFLVSIGQAPPPEERVSRRYSVRVQRRRHIAGGLLIAMAVTFLMGLLPTFRVLLVVNLFLVDSFLGYIAVLAHQANRAGRPEPGAEQAPAERPPARVRVRLGLRPHRVPQPAIAPLG